MAKKDTGDRRRASDKVDTSRDAEGTERSEEAKAGLDAGLLKAPPADEPLGS
jgi:hypothetical protein